MKAIIEKSDGITVDLEVIPNASKFQIYGYNEWRNRLNVKIKSIPNKGKANKEIMNEFKKLTNCSVEIISGQKSHQKTIKIFAITKEKFQELLKIYI
jgi:hypothetical protein